MLQLYYRQTFQNRVRVTIIVLIVLAVSLTGWGSYWIASDIVESNAARSGQDTINKSKQVLDERLRHIAVSVMTLVISDAYKNMLQDVSQGETSQYYNHLSSIQPLFSQIKLNEPMIQTVLISTPIGDFYHTGRVRNTRVPFVGSDMYKQLKDANTNLWLPTHTDQLFTGEEQVISLVMESTTENQVKDIYIVVNVLEKSLKDAMKENWSAANDDVVLVTPEGTAVLNSAPLSTYSESDYIMNYAQLTMNEGWTLVSIQKRSELLKELIRIKWIMLGVAIGCIIIALLISRILMGFLMKPLQSLRVLMRRVENNELTVRYESKFTDEFSRVGERFNRMLDQISTLITTIKNIEAEKRMAEVKVLQAQISPHFLYNTLNTIYWRSQLGQNEDVGEMVLSLSSMFQLGLNGGQDMTTIDRELTHVEQYLILQMNCYEHLFEYSIEVERQTLRERPILKLMLQPLVENCILHGFKNVKSGGKIDISVTCSGDLLEIKVSDNGKGMNVEKVMDRIQNHSEDDEGNSYALKNTYNRLQLYYGAESSMTFHSESGVRTTVTLLIPILGES
jgi:two-component system sensor histidine kinase YesM